ncbi:MAG: DNRLRE domain-containing protein [Chloroflexota bacterium]
MPDAYIVSGAPDTTYNNWALLSGAYTNGHKSTLLRFDWSGGLPANANIQWAGLGLYQYYRANSSTVQIYRITSDWQQDTVTWNSFNNAYDSTLIGSWQTGGSGWYGADITHLVRQWLSGEVPNYGILLDHPGAGGAVGYYSSEYTAIPYRPQLVICYTQDNTPTPQRCIHIHRCSAGDPNQQEMSIPPLRMIISLYLEMEILSSKRSIMKFCNTAWAEMRLFFARFLIPAFNCIALLITKPRGTLG